MKHDGYTTKLTALLRAHHQEVPAEAQAGDLVELLIHSFMLWEASTPQADNAMEKIKAATVDFNDFRVSLVNEIIEMIGPRYPRAHERSVRVRAALNDLFRREHKVSLERTHQMAKRDAKAYIDGLQGMVPYVSGRVAVLGLGIHAIPVDDNHVNALIANGVFQPETPLTEATSWLNRHIHAEKARDAHLALQSAVDSWISKGGLKRPPTRTPAGRAAKSPRPERAPARAGRKASK